MYKKITHTITEEHFAHPMAMEIKKLVDKLIKPKAIDPVTSAQLNVALQQYFTTFVNNMHNIITNMSDSNAMRSAENAAYTDIISLGSILNPYYGTDVINNITKMLTTFVSDFSLFLASAYKTKSISYVNFQNGTNNLATNISYYLNKVNSNWDHDAIFNIFMKAVPAWILLANAIANNNNADAIANQNVINGLFFAGQPDGTPGLSTIMYNGIVQQFA